MPGIWLVCLLWGGVALGGPLPAVERVVVGAQARSVAIPLMERAGDGAVEVRGPAGEPLEASVTTLVLRELPRGVPRWLGVPGTWSRAETAGEREGAPGVLRAVSVVVAALPAAEGDVTLTLGEARVEVIHDGSADVLSARARAAAGALPSGTDLGGLVKALEPGLGWPAYRDRAAAVILAAGGVVEAATVPAAPGEVRAVEPARNVLEMLAEQETRAWSRGLARLRGESAEIADRVEKCLTRLVVFEGGRALPLWPDPAAEEALLRVLLDERADGERVRGAADEFVGGMAGVLAWVIDDTGRAGADGQHAVARLGLANLGEREAVAWLDVAGAADESAGEPTLVGAGCSATVEASVPVGVVGAREAVMGAARPVPVSVTVRLGDARATAGVRAARLPVVPPGATLGPLMEDWSMVALWRGVASPPASVVPGGGSARGEGWLTAARLSLEPGEGEAGGVWMLQVQCQFDASVGTDGDEVEVWVGPSGRPASVRRVRADGAVQTLVGEAGPERVEVRRGVKREAVGVWWCQVPLPRGAMEEPGGVRLGLVRRDARGVRSAFPRAMMPGQTEPGRLLLDPAGWDLGK